MDGSINVPELVQFRVKRFDFFFAIPSNFLVVPGRGTAPRLVSSEVYVTNQEQI